MPLSFAPPPSATPTLNVLLYGPPKTGKTTGAASAPGPILYLNLDLPNAARFAHLLHGGEIREAQFEGLQTLNDVVHELHSGNTDYRTVVVDPVGDLHRALLEEASDRAVRPTLNAYGDTSTYVERFCRSLCQAPVNVVLVCHDYEVRDEATGEVMRLPWTGTSNPRLGRALMGMVDIVGYTGVVEDEEGELTYVAQLVPAKGRIGGVRGVPAHVLGKARP